MAADCPSLVEEYEGSDGSTVMISEAQSLLTFLAALGSGLIAGTSGLHQPVECGSVAGCDVGQDDGATARIVIDSLPLA